MIELLLILFLLGGAVYFLNKQPTYSKHKFNLSDKVNVPSMGIESGIVSEIYRGSSSSDYFYEYTVFDYKTLKHYKKIPEKEIELL